MVVWLDHTDPGVLSSGDRIGDEGGNKSCGRLANRKPTGWMRTYPTFTTPDATLRIALCSTVQLLSAPWFAWLSSSSSSASFFATATETSRVPFRSRGARNDAPLHRRNRLQAARAGSRAAEPREFRLAGWGGHRGLFKPLRYRR